MQVITKRPQQGKEAARRVIAGASTGHQFNTVTDCLPDVPRTASLFVDRGTGQPLHHVDCWPAQATNSPRYKATSDTGVFCVNERQAHFPQSRLST